MTMASNEALLNDGLFWQPRDAQIEEETRLVKALHWFVPSTGILPRWACDDSLRNLTHQEWNEIPLSRCCGAAIKYAFYNLANVWLLYIAVPIMTYLLCEDPHNGNFAVLDDTLIWISVFLVFAPVSIFLQFRCTCYVVPKQLAVTKKFELLGFPFYKFHYAFWLLCTSVLTVLNLMDLVTNGEVLGRALATRYKHCSSYHLISSAWTSVVKQAPLFHGAIISNFDGTLLAVYLSCLAQPIFALMCKIPLDEGVLIDIIVSGLDYRKLHNLRVRPLLKLLEWSTQSAILELAGDGLCRLSVQIEHGPGLEEGQVEINVKLPIWSQSVRNTVEERLRNRSEELASRIQSNIADIWCLRDQGIFQVQVDPQRVRICPKVAYAIDHQGEEQQYAVLYNARTTHHAVLMVLAETSRMEAVLFQDFAYANQMLDLMQAGTHRDDEWQERFLQLAFVQIQRGVARLFLKGFLQTAFQSSVQITVMALYRHVTAERAGNSGVIDGQMLFSVVLTMLGLVTDFPDAIDIIKMVRTVFLAITAEQIEDIKDQNWNLYVRCTDLRRSIQFRAARFVVYMLLYVWVYAWAVLKLWAYFYCDSHLYNLMEGCVTFHHRA